jgi:peptidoglycan/LPS O-acetylase OafA/YrhL
VEQSTSRRPAGFTSSRIVAERESSPLASSPQHTRYRPDIDGLRAVAVLGVVGFHAFPRWVHSGFVGVDVFFVISGYLISSIIYNALRVGRFSYMEFYVRRVRRIFPALLVVLATSVVVGWLVLFPDEYKQLGREVAAGAGFAANFLFWSQSGYFDAQAAVKPLLHLWSLGIEEQFYLVWPLLVAFLYRRTRRVPMWIALLMCGSFLVNALGIQDHTSAMFYLPMSRFWELLSGALLAYWVMFGSESGSDRGARTSKTVLALCGVLLLVVAATKINEESEFPGYWALLPVGGTLCLIASSGSWLNRVVLAQPALVFIGLISYPLYLWHWVLLALLRMSLYDGAEVPRTPRIVAVLLSVLLASATYELIEKPIRFGTRTAVRALWKPAGLVASMVLVGIVGVGVYRSDGVALRYPPQIRPLAAFELDEARRWYIEVLDGQCFDEDPIDGGSGLGAQCVQPADGRRKLLVVWGDSHAASLYPGLKAQQARHPEYRLAQFTWGGCPPMLDWDSYRVPQCRAFNAAALAKVAALRPDIVVLAGDWLIYFSKSGGSEADLAPLESTIQQLHDRGVPRIVVFGNIPVWQLPAPRVGMKLWVERHDLPQRSQEYLDTDSLRADDLVRHVIAKVQGVEFVSPIDALCDSRGCILTTSRTRWIPVTLDTSHLTIDGSKYLLDHTAGEIFTEGDAPRGARPVTLSAPSPAGYLH